MTVSTTTGKCVCDPDYYELIGASCIRKSTAARVRQSFPLDAVKMLSLRDIETVDGSSTNSDTVPSWTFENLFFENAVLCKERLNRTACQVLGNLCVLQKYAVESAACGFYDELALVGQPTQGFTDWKQPLPWLRYNDDKVLRSGALQTAYTLFVAEEPDPLRATSALVQFKLAVYTPGGHFLGMEDLSSQLELCIGDPAKANHWQRFGSKYVNKCVIDLQTLLDSPLETLFYDL
jgi:meckelin